MFALLSLPDRSFRSQNVQFVNLFWQSAGCAIGPALEFRDTFAACSPDGSRPDWLSHAAKSCFGLAAAGPENYQPELDVNNLSLQTWGELRKARIASI